MITEGWNIDLVNSSSPKTLLACNQNKSCNLHWKYYLSNFYVRMTMTAGRIVINVFNKLYRLKYQNIKYNAVRQQL